MTAIFYRCLEWLRWALGIVPKSAVGSPTTYLIVVYAFWTLVVVIFALSSNWLKSLTGIPGDIILPRGLGWLADVWWGAIVLLGLAMVRVVMYLLHVLGIEEESEFPDIESDWQEILSALERDRLYIDDLPLFVVNGLTPQQEQSALETASNIEWKVIAPPLTKSSAVIRAFARDDMILLCCTGVGTTNCQQGKVSLAPEQGAATGTVRLPPASVTGTRKAGEIDVGHAAMQNVTGTQTAVAPPVREAAVSQSAPSMGGVFGTMMPGSLKKAMETFTAMNDSGVKGFGKKRLSPISPIERAVGTRRMQCLCQLIIEARKPFCGINGVLQAFPFSWARDVEYARGLAPAIRDDLVTMHSEFHLQFPVVAIVTELDSVAGVREFLLRAERLQPGLRMSRAGSRFAPGADVNDQNAGWVIDRAMQWFRGWIYTAFAYDIDSRDNQKLFHMMCEVSQRRDALVALLRESLYKIVEPPVRLYGAYFAATGRSTTEQGFIRGVLDKLPESQSEVAWTPQYVQTQGRSRLLASLLFAGTVLIAAGIVWAGIEFNKNR